MNSMSKKIYDALYITLVTDQFMHMSDLERICGVKSRCLQGQKGLPGPLDIAIEEIYLEKRLHLITMAGRAGGIKITNDKKEVLLSIKKLSSHSINEMGKVRLWQKQLKSDIKNNNSQLAFL